MTLSLHLPKLFIALLLLPLAGCSPNAAPKPEVVETPKKATSIIPVGYDKVSSSLYAKDLNSPGNKKAGFEVVTDSGVDFTNTFDRMKPFRYIETGAGVALADYDNDGQIDIYLVATDGPNKLYRGLGNFKFEDVTAKAGVDGNLKGKDAWGAGATFGDVDGDGDLDLLVSNMAARNVIHERRRWHVFRRGYRCRNSLMSAPTRSPVSVTTTAMETSISIS